MVYNWTMNLLYARASVFVKRKDNFQLVHILWIPFIHLPKVEKKRKEKRKNDEYN